MEMIEISGYVTEEKVEIAKRYLIPKQHEETGITADQIKITDDSLTYLIDKHCRESGVRNLQKKIQRIFRKSAVKVVQGDKVRIFIFWKFTHRDIFLWLSICFLKKLISSNN